MPAFGAMVHESADFRSIELLVWLARLNPEGGDWQVAVGSAAGPPIHAASPHRNSKATADIDPLSAAPAGLALTQRLTRGHSTAAASFSTDPAGDVWEHRALVVFGLSSSRLPLRLAAACHVEYGGTHTEARVLNWPVRVCELWSPAGVGSKMQRLVLYPHECGEISPERGSGSA